MSEDIFLSELKSLSESVKPRPIETAPKDGTKIQLFKEKKTLVGFYLCSEDFNGDGEAGGYGCGWCCNIDDPTRKTQCSDIRRPKILPR
ncbi:MAG: hypothetical protein ACK5LJ_17760 [Paracoccus sp. (in: a-proteobacteria)]